MGLLEGMVAIVSGSRARRNAVDRPCPIPAPVTIATLPSKRAMPASSCRGCTRDRTLEE